jgi:hypothetical protein
VLTDCGVVCRSLEARLLAQAAEMDKAEDALK